MKKRNWIIGAVLIVLVLAVLTTALVAVGSAFMFTGVTTTVSEELVSVRRTPLADLSQNIHILHVESIVQVMQNTHIPQDMVVNGDVVAVMGNLVIDGIINGDAVAVMGNVEVNGTVAGDVVAVMGNVEVNGTVYGATTTVIGSLREGVEGRVHGGGVRVGAGLLQQHDFSFARRGWGFSLFNGSFRFFELIILFVLGSLSLTLLLGNIKAMAFSLGKEPWRKLFIGFVVLIVIPLIMLAMAISIIGIPFIPLLVLLLFLGRFLGYVAVALYVGSRLVQVGNFKVNLFVELFLGVLMLWLLRLVPVIRPISYLLVTMFALGVIIDTRLGSNKPWFGRREYRSLTEETKQEEND